MDILLSTNLWLDKRPTRIFKARKWTALFGDMTATMTTTLITDDYNGINFVKIYFSNILIKTLLNKQYLRMANYFSVLWGKVVSDELSLTATA